MFRFSFSFSFSGLASTVSLFLYVYGGGSKGIKRGGLRCALCFLFRFSFIQIYIFPLGRVWIWIGFCHGVFFFWTSLTLFICAGIPAQWALLYEYGLFFLLFFSFLLARLLPVDFFWMSVLPGYLFQIIFLFLYLFPFPKYLGELAGIVQCGWFGL